MTTLITAQIKTKSNYRNFNGSWLQVTEMNHKRITCIAEVDGKMIKIDFCLSEITGFMYNTSKY